MEPSDEELLARYGHHPAPPAEGEVVEGPTDEELWDIGERHLWTGTDESVTNYRILTSFIEAARAVLARYGHQPAPPAEGEDKAPAVTEVIAWLRTEAEIDDGFELAQSAAYQRRAADLLEQRHPAPVPVSERLPGPEDCDAEERCWLLAPRWILPPQELTYWLPATALPLPAGEVE